MSLPDLSRRKDRLAAIARAKAEIEARAAERFAREQTEHEEKLEKRRECEEQPGKKARGREPKALGKVEMVVADTGYFSQKNLQHCHNQKVIPLIASKREQHNQPLPERFANNRDRPEPDPDDAVACMLYNLTGQGGPRYTPNTSAL